MKYIKIMLISGLTVMFMTACDNDKGLEIKAGDKKIELSIDNDMNDIESRFERMGEAIDKKIKEIDEGMADVGEEIKKDLEKQKMKLQESRKDLKNRMGKMSAASKDNWDEFKSDTEKFFDQLQKDLKMK